MDKLLLLILFSSSVSSVCASLVGATNAVNEIIRNNQVNWGIRTPLIILNPRTSDFVDLAHVNSGTPICASSIAQAGFCNYARTFFTHRKTVVIQVPHNVDNDAIALTLICNNNCFHIFVTPDRTTTRLLLQLVSVKRLKFKAVVYQEPQVLILYESLESWYSVVEVNPSTVHLYKVFNPRWLQVRNRHIYPATFKKEPHAVLDSNGKPLLGTNVEAFKASSKTFNFTYDLQLAPIVFFKHPNGSWGGVLGDIVQGKVDMMYSKLAPNSERVKVVEYAAYGSAMDLTFITGHPTVNTDWTSFTKPFDAGAWAALATILLVLFSSLCLEFVIVGHAKPVSSAIIIVFGPLLAQGVSIPTAARAPVLVWVFGTILIVNYFTSNLLSHITFPVADPIPRNFEELSARDDYDIKIMAMRGGTVETLFKRTELPVYTKIRDRYKPTTDFAECVIKAGTEPKTACIGFSMHMLPLVMYHLKLRKQFDPVLISEEPMTRIPLHSVLQKDSKYLSSLNFITCWTRDTGIARKWFTDVLDYFERGSIQWMKSDEGKEAAKKLSQIVHFLLTPPVQKFKIRHLYMGFGTLLVGAVLSLIVFQAETAIYRWKTRRQLHTHDNVSEISSTTVEKEDQPG